jgi:hypothetical protein
LQETTGRDDWAATLDLIPSILRAEPDFGLFDLGSTLMLLALSNASGDGPYLLPTTRTAGHLSEVVAEFAGSNPEAIEEAALFRLGQAVDLAGISGRIRAADQTSTERLAGAAAAGLIQAGRIEDAFSLLGLVPSPKLSHDISRLAVLHTLSISGPAAAQALALRFANRGDRIDALFAVAHEWATDGHPDQALAIARDLPNEVWLSDDRSDAWLLGEILASGGEAFLLIETTYPNRPAILGPHRPIAQIELTAAILKSDIPAAFAALDQYPAGSETRKTMLNQGLQASWIASGQDGADQLLALLPDQDHPDALAALGLAQIGTAAGGIGNRGADIGHQPLEDDATLRESRGRHGRLGDPWAMPSSTVHQPLDGNEVGARSTPISCAPSRPPGRTSRSGGRDGWRRWPRPARRPAPCRERSARVLSSSTRTPQASSPAPWRRSGRFP